MGLNSKDVWGHFAPMFHLVDAFAIFAITLVGGRHAILPTFSAQAALSTIGALPSRARTHLVAYSTSVFMKLKSTCNPDPSLDFTQDNCRLQECATCVVPGARSRQSVRASSISYFAVLHAVLQVYDNNHAKCAFNYLAHILHNVCVVPTCLNMPALGTIGPAFPQIASTYCLVLSHTFYLLCRNGACIRDQLCLHHGDAVGQQPLAATAGPVLPAPGLLRRLPPSPSHRQKGSCCLSLPLLHLLRHD